MKIGEKSNRDIYLETETKRINSYYYAIVKDKESNNTYRGKTLAELKYMIAIIYDKERHTGYLFNCMFTNTVNDFISLLQKEERLWLDCKIDEGVEYEIPEQITTYDIG